MPTKRKLIRDKAVELIKRNPKGLRWSELIRELGGCFPNIRTKTIIGSAWGIHQTRQSEIYKPTRGLYKYRFEDENQVEQQLETEVQVPPRSLSEYQFYGPFADWLKNDLGECTEALTLGGSWMGKKWGTPDVIGIYRPSTRDIVKFQPEIISAEIKLSPTDPITAFGQAVSYRLFSSKVYLVEPSSMVPEDQDRIEALCVLFGIGFILFGLEPANPSFIIRVRAQRNLPDVFYVNEFAEKLYNKKRDVFDKLFGK